MVWVLSYSKNPYMTTSFTLYSNVKKTSDHERKYTSFELEVLAVVEALKKFHIYVLGTSFKIITDCDALVKTLSKKKKLNLPLQLVSQDLMAKLKNKKFHHHFCAVKTFCRRSREMVFSRTPPARNPELNFSKKHQDDSI
ncbi:hypothetical protein TNCV_479331 [Trichonephila clavipes]|nr:hypothetical protein TNCV_479331 [Trichonephila clavipes]